MGNERKAAPTAAEILAARLSAAKDLKTLFGGKTAEGEVTKGVLHEYSLEALLAQPSWAELISGVRKNQHAKTLAVISCTHGDEKFPPNLVAEIFSDTEAGHDPEWYEKVFLGGHLEIFRSTNGTIGTMLHPMQVGIDMLRATENVFDHISDEEGLRLGLSKPKDSVRRQLAPDLDSILGELSSFGTPSNPDITAACKLYRWMLRKQAAQAAKRAADNNPDENEADPAGALPGAGKKPEPADPRVALEAQITETDAAVKVAAAKGTAEGFTEAGRLTSVLTELRKKLEALDAKPVATPTVPVNGNAAAVGITALGPGAPPPAPPATDGKKKGSGNRKKPGLLSRVAQATGFAAPPPAPPTAAAAPPPPPNAPVASLAPPPPPPAAVPAPISAQVMDETSSVTATLEEFGGLFGKALVAQFQAGKLDLDTVKSKAHERSVPGF